MPTGNPILQAVLLFQHHQTTTPFAPLPDPTESTPPSTMAAPVTTKKEETNGKEHQ